MLFRLDRFLTECDPSLTRKSAKALLHDGAVTVNGRPVRDAAFKLDTDKDTVCVGGKLLTYRQFRYFTINKTAGVLSASRDNRTKTVVDLIDGIGDDYFPVGRLDKDTEGLLIITNDGALAHELLSPRKHVPKTYIAVCRGLLGDTDCERLQNGIDLGDFTTAPAKALILQQDSLENEATTTIALTITEGKFHQVKRMIEAVGSEVLYLQRVRMGGLWLPLTLEKGAYLETDGEALKKELFQDGTEDEERLLRSYL
ncbi:MAG: rRNA pseudouridine synthase [Lachnospiraceae bacterium]|nr:rRNA pseudouridine synthase [Lachnospiraceae bacterium]